MDPILTGRSALFCPADHPERAVKALASSADIVILDLEDAVAPAAKGIARDELAEILAAATDRPGVIVRVNDPASDTGAADLTALATMDHNAAIMVPKLSLDTPLGQLPTGTKMIGLIETAEAVRDIHEIATLASVTRLALGAVDLSTQLGCEPTSATIDAVRAQLVLASVAAGLAPPLDSPCVNFRDPEVIEQAAGRARRDGFGGMLCIHPAQLPAVSAAYRPTERQLTWARKVLSVGDAAASVDGEMVDRPVILRAQQIIGAAEES